MEYDNLIKWFKENGGYINDKLYIHYDEKTNNRTVKTKEDIQIGELLFTTPQELIFSPSLITSIPKISKKELEKYKEDNLKLIVVLSYHLSIGEKSKFKIFLDLLPKMEDFKNHPLNLYTEDQYNKISEISEYYARKIKEYHQVINENYEKIKKYNKVLPESEITFEKIKYYFLIVSTRDWDIGMVPFADMFQHKNSSNIFLQEVNLINNYSNNNPYIIPKDEEVFINYGHKIDENLLLDYGFIHDDDDDRIIHIDLVHSLQPNNSINILKINEFKKIEDKKAFLKMNEIDNNILSKLRILMLSKEDLFKLNLDIPYYESLISIENEKDTLKILLKMIDKNRDKYLKVCQGYQKVFEIIEKGDDGSLLYKISFIIYKTLEIFEKSKFCIKDYWLELLLE